MKITHIGHASLLVKTGGLHILSDPWWRGPCFGAQWWIYPLPYLDPVRNIKIDYIYISHGHEDHFHPPTLRTLDRSAKLLAYTGSSFLEEARALGFDVVEIGAGESRNLGNNVLCRIIPTHGGDTLMTLTDGSETLVNMNDAIHPLPGYARRKFIRAIKKAHPNIDYLFCGHGVASHFPNCYVIPEKDRDATAQRRQLYFNNVWADIVAEIEPRYAFPFAADVVLLENDLQWGNEQIHNTTRPTEIFLRQYPNMATHAIDIASGFEIDAGIVTRAKHHVRLSMDDVRMAYADKIAQANRYGSVRDDNVDAVYELLVRNVKRKAAYLENFRGEYRILIQFRGGKSGLLITKSGRHISVAKSVDTESIIPTCDVVFVTKLAYLQRSLTTHFGADLLFVGSGGVFHYITPRALDLALNNEVMVMVSPSFSTGSRLQRRLKEFLKRLVDRDELDLYNVKRWTVFASK